MSHRWHSFIRWWSRALRVPFRVNRLSQVATVILIQLQQLREQGDRMETGIERLRREVGEAVTVMGNAKALLTEAAEKIRQLERGDGDDVEGDLNEFADRLDAGANDLAGVNLTPPPSATTGDGGTSTAPQPRDGDTTAVPGVIAPDPATIATETLPADMPVQHDRDTGDEIHEE